MPQLRADSIVAGYGSGPPILNGVSVTAEAARITVILGPNGAGKSTLAKAIVGRLPIRSGHVHLDQTELTRLRTYELVRRGVAYLPQVMNVFDQMTVQENLEMGGYTRKSVLQHRIGQLYEVFPDLVADKRKKAGALSGGQQRMLALARMLMTDPVIAILDEPTAGLSPLYSDLVWERLSQIRELGVGLLVIEQNAHTAMERADTVILLELGRNVLTGAASEVRDSDEITRILVG
jgi:ABC-type branched-subunit amino acid transport system ATPase component